MQAWIRTQGSPAAYENSAGTPEITVSSGPVTSVALTSNQVAPLATTTPITWTAAASGGTAPLLYQFYRYDEVTNSWVIAQAWSATRRYTWTPSRGEFGIHAIQVWVRSSGSTAAYEAWAGTGYFLIVP